jgi:hypothetical protein
MQKGLSGHNSQPAGAKMVIEERSDHTALSSKEMLQGRVSERTNLGRRRSFRSYIEGSVQVNDMKKRF